MAFPTKNVLFLSHNNEISAVVHHDLSLQTDTQHWTDLVQITGWLALCATGSYVQQD